MTGEYCAPADFRLASLAEFAAGLSLTDDEAETTRLTAAIARMSQRFDNACNDHFSTETGIVLTLRGNETTLLDLPRRCTAVTQVAIVNSSGTSTVQAATSYRLHSSLDPAGAEVRSPGARDWLEVVPYQYLTGLSYGSGTVWPCEPNSVVVTGTFGWTVTPADVKRAVAIMVWDHFKPLRADLRSAASFTTADISVQRAEQIPEVAEIITAYTYRAKPEVLVG